MRSKNTLVIAVVALAGAVALVEQRRETIRLRGEIETAKKNPRLSRPIREEDGRTESAPVLSSGGSASLSAASAIGRDVGAEHARSPELGLAAIDVFRNVGRATPSDAFQTLIWAALTGADELVAETCFVDGATRAKADALLARLPAGGRRRFPTPESVAVLAIAAEVTKGGELHLEGFVLDDPTHATLTVRIGGSGRKTSTPMRLGPGGWQFVVPAKAIDAIERWMAESASESPKE